LWKAEITNHGLYTNDGGSSLFNSSGSVVGSVGCAGVENDRTGVNQALNLWNDNVYYHTLSSSDDDDCPEDRDALLALTIIFGLFCGFLLSYIVFTFISKKDDRLLGK
jgi:hypothetical protein